MISFKSEYDLKALLRTESMMLGYAPMMSYTITNPRVSVGEERAVFKANNPGPRKPSGKNRDKIKRARKQKRSGK